MLFIIYLFDKHRMVGTCYIRFRIRKQDLDLPFLRGCYKLLLLLLEYDLSLSFDDFYTYYLVCIIYIASVFLCTSRAIY